MNPFGTGANESPQDDRHWKHETTMAVPLVSGGYDYLPADIEHQHIVGICTAISLIQNAQKALGRKYSSDFQYLLQKKYIDGNWIEGSSIFAALKVGKTYGFLPLELFTWVTEEDRKLPYPQYIAKLQAIPNAEIIRLLLLCADKLSGYAMLGTDAQSVAKGILDSRSGVLCRYDVSENWWSPSWAQKDIDPLKKSINNVSGHAINMSRFHSLSITQQDYDNLKNGTITVEQLEQKYGI